MFSAGIRQKTSIRGCFLIDYYMHQQEHFPFGKHVIVLKPSLRLFTDQEICFALCHYLSNISRPG